MQKNDIQKGHCSGGFIAVHKSQPTAAVTLRRIIDVFLDSNNHNLALSKRHVPQVPWSAALIYAFRVSSCSSFSHRSASVKSPRFTYGKRERAHAGTGRPLIIRIANVNVARKCVATSAQSEDCEEARRLSERKRRMIAARGIRVPVCIVSS